MRTAFETWASRDGHIVRRREDKPDEYLVYETQRRWLIWQAALEHGKTPARRKAVQQVATIGADEATVRAQVLNEVLDAFSGLQGNSGMDDILNVIQGLKQKQKSQSAD
jgi:hypothetical protein